MAKVTALILAAGEGKRMASSLPKVVHNICGRSLVGHVLDAAAAVSDEQIVVVGYGAEEVRSELGLSVKYVTQAEQRGTGHAVMQAVSLLTQGGTVLVLCGDTPLLSSAVLDNLLHTHQEKKAAATVLTALVPNPAGYGRIIRSASGSVQKIVEDRDAVPDELRINEINTGTYAFDTSLLLNTLGSLVSNNDQGEYYLTDCLELLAASGSIVESCLLENYQDALGVNDRIHLSEAERLMRQGINEKLMAAGVTMIDPSATYIDVGVEVGQDTVLFPGTILRGGTRVGRNCRIGPNTEISNCEVGSNVSIRYSVITESILEDGVIVGPFAHLRPGTRLRQNVKIGDFVEIKKSDIGYGSKVPHLSYIGDAEIGSKVNMGAGTIVVNYDGRSKHTTHIGDGAFIGCNSNLIAPLHVGKEAFIAAGSTITKDIPEGSLSLARSKQVNKENMGRLFLNKK